MAKNLKLNIKNTQLAKALNLDGVKDKLDKKKADSGTKKEEELAKKLPAKKSASTQEPTPKVEEQVEEKRRVKARSRSVFSEDPKAEEPQEEVAEEPVIEEVEEAIAEPETVVEEPTQVEEPEPTPPPIEEQAEAEPVVEPPKKPFVKLGPTGRHINDLLPPKRPKAVEPKPEPAAQSEVRKPPAFESDDAQKKGVKGKFKEFRDLKPTRKPAQQSGFDSRDKHGLREPEELPRWRKRRAPKVKRIDEALTVRPSELHIRLPISIKELANTMKLKSSQLIEKLFLQGVMMTLNDLLDDETVIQLLGQEFGCAIKIDTSEEERIRITDKTIQEEVAETPEEELKLRAPVVAFMGHVDHGKTSLIDYIRKSNRVSGEAGAITQHIGAFRCKTAVGDIAILDTPGHEAFSAMRARGADATDIVVLVIAGDEGLKTQTEEAIQHAKAAGVTIIVAINKCDKPNYDPDTVYRQLADHELLPEKWGGQTITVRCSAVTGEGIPELLEMLALQAEVLELRASHSGRARGAVLESEMHKGLGAVATVLVQNGTLKLGDALVFDQHWCRVKTMHDEHGKLLDEAGPSTPVEITGLSGLPAAGQEFIVVKSEKEAKEIAAARADKVLEGRLQRKRHTTESFLSEGKTIEIKILNIILRADVQGSLEALKSAIMKIKSEKVEVNFIFTGIGEISESDVQLAAASKAVILGFHTQVESHAEPLIKELGVQIRLHDVIYHLVDDARDLMAGTLDSLPEEIEKGKAEVRAIFKSSQHGIIAGCYVTEGSLHRNHHLRIIRNGEKVWIGQISSLKRVKEDVREIQKGFECGVLVTTNDILEGDILEAYEIIYIKQEL